jgi:hypothetical protein
MSLSIIIPPVIVTTVIQTSDREEYSPI